MECGPKISARSWKSIQTGPELGRLRKRTLDIPRLVSAPPEDSLTPFESTQLTALREKGSLFKFVNLQFFRPDKHCFWQIVSRQFSLRLTSLPLRYGCILYSLHKNDGTLYSDHCRSQYLNRFIQATCEAIKRNDITAILYGSYAVCMYSIRTATITFHDFEVHVRGFSASVSQYFGRDAKSIDVEERFLVECMREKLVWKAAQRFLFNTSWASSDLQHVSTTLYSLSDDMLSPCSHQPDWLTQGTAEIQLKLKFIRIVTQLYSRSTEDSLYETVKLSLVERFHRDFGTRLRRQPSISLNDTAEFRLFSVRLWSKLLDCVSILCLPQPLLSNQALSDTLLSIYLLVDEVLFFQKTESRVLFDIASYSLVLISLSLVGGTEEDPYCTTT
jgi:hypothetical protein